jgi:hypothetical protein
VWFDQDLSGGQVWWNQILKTVRDCDVFVFVLNPESLNSTACKREYCYAVDLGKTILPVLVAEGVSTNLLPTALSKIQFVDYRKQDRTAALCLARALTTIPPSEPLPKPLPLPPEAPISYLTSLTEKIETASTLNYEKQSTLLIDLKRSLLEPETTDDTHVLLKRLRKRRDLLASIAGEIDELLVSKKGVSTPLTHSLESELPAQKLPYTARLQRKTEDFENTDISHYPLSRYKLSSLVKPAFMLLCGLSLIFFIITIVNFGNRDSGLEGLSTNIETNFESPMFPDLRKLDASIERQKRLLESQPSEVETKKLGRMVEERDEMIIIIDKYNETAKNMIEGIGNSSNIK